MNAMVESIREFGHLKIAAMVGTAIVLIGFFAYLSLGASNPVMSPLYSGVTPDDTRYIVRELQKQGVAYEMMPNSNEILVPTERVLQLRMSLAEQGLPSAGSMVGYEIFDKSDAMGTSNFVLNLNKLRALEGELSRTIGTIENVEAARVHLVMPKRELFTRERQEPSASVALKMMGRKEPTKAQVAAIRHIVATAVPRLKPTRITIIDAAGRLLARGVEDENDPEALASTAQEFRTNYERKMKDKIERLLEQYVGYGKVRAEVTADVDFDRIETNSETFDPEGQVARSTQAITENEQTQDKDLKENVTVGNQLPDTDPNAAGLLSSSNIQRTDETTNFEISKQVKKHIKQTGTVNRLSVAVMIDGNYVTIPDTAEGAEEGATTTQYEARSADELEKMQNLVASAIGFNAERGDELQVESMQFATFETEELEESPFSWLEDDLSSIIQTLVLGGVAILVILMVIRPLVNRAIADAEEYEEDEMMEQSLLTGDGILAQLPDLTDEEEDTMISINRVKGGVKSSTYRKVNDMIDKHPEESLGVLRRWAFMPTE